MLTGLGQTKSTVVRLAPVHTRRDGSPEALLGLQVPLQLNEHALVWCGDVNDINSSQINPMTTSKHTLD